MPTAEHVSPKRGETLLLVGTMKGAFLFRHKKNSKWEMGGPYFPGSAVYAMAYDNRDGRHRLWAGASSMHVGALLRSSEDFGANWTNPEEAHVKFPKKAGAALKNIWQIAIGRDDKTMFCGVEPAALFVSKDAGESWKLNNGLWNHPQRTKWMPGGGGLCLHTILLDPQDRKRIRIAISTAGMYVTEDGGKSWRPSNQGVRAVFLPNKYPEFGQCVHKVVQSRQQPDRMYLQNHWGLYRSDDRGETWNDIANGVPSDFGFPVAVHPDDPDPAVIVPPDADILRWPPDGKLRVSTTSHPTAERTVNARGLLYFEVGQQIYKSAVKRLEQRYPKQLEKLIKDSQVFQKLIHAVDGKDLSLDAKNLKDIGTQLAELSKDVLKVFSPPEP